MSKKEKPLLQLEDEDSFFETNSVISSTECTGMIPDLPCTEEAADAYKEIYDVPKQDETPDLVKKTHP